MKLQKESMRNKERLVTKTMNKIKTEVVKTGIAMEDSDDSIVSGKKYKPAL